MEAMAMSVVIPVSKDLKLRKCLETIDTAAEIIIVLNNNPSLEILDLISSDRRCHPVFVETPGCNLAKVLNIGIQATSYEKILIMNSDCFFSPGLLAKINDSLDRYPVVKAQVEFEYGDWRQKLVAQCRRLFHQVLDGGQKLFGPGLAFHKSLKEWIGGYYFDEKMGWGEDGEMSTRIRQSGVDFLILPEKIYHTAEGIKHDLRIAFKIGLGNGRRETVSPPRLLQELRIDFQHFFTDHHQQFKTARREGGWSLWLYLLAWKLSFHLGYYITYITIIKRKGD